MQILLLVSPYQEEKTAKQSTFSRPIQCIRTFLNDDKARNTNICEHVR